MPIASDEQVLKLEVSIDKTGGTQERLGGRKKGAGVRSSATRSWRAQQQVLSDLLAMGRGMALPLGVHVSDRDRYFGGVKAAPRRRSLVTNAGGGVGVSG